MAVGGVSGLDLPFLAETAIVKYRCVKLGTVADSVTAVTGTTDFVIGVCQETISAADATAGRITDVRVEGVSVIEADAAITRGVRVKVSADGQVLAVTEGVGNERIVGVALSGAANAGEYIKVLLTPAATFNAAVS